MVFSLYHISHISQDNKSVNSHFPQIRAAICHISQPDAPVYLFQFFFIYIKFYLNIPPALIQKLHLPSWKKETFLQNPETGFSHFGTLSTIVLCLLNKFPPIISIINTLFFSTLPAIGEYPYQ